MYIFSALALNYSFFQRQMSCGGETREREREREKGKERKSKREKGKEKERKATDREEERVIPMPKCKGPRNQ